MAQLQSMRDAPGTQREYETIFILRGDTAQEAIAPINARVRGIIEQMSGKLLKVDNWGKRKLAYEVRKQLKGIFLYWRYLGSSGLVEELERNLKMLDAVVRFYTVKVDEDVVPDVRPSEVTDESFAQAGTTGPDEEEIMTGAASASRFGDDDDADEGDVIPGAAKAAAVPAVAEEPAAPPAAAAPPAKEE